MTYELAGNETDTSGRGLFFTGTDTGVGKTWVTAGAARALRQQGRAVAVCKPVATGCIPGPEGLHSEDTRLLAHAAGVEGSLERVTPWRFAEPVAPSVAARLHGVALSLAAMVAAARRWQAPQGIVLVEGVGGLLCPLTEKETVVDLAAKLGFPLVIVARRSLGTLNHTLLTLSVARAHGLKVAGVVVNDTAPCDGPAAQTNVDELRRWIGVPVLAVVPYRMPGDGQETLSAVEWWTLGAANLLTTAQALQHPTEPPGLPRR
jgi:dethiobiotin synthetase